MQETPKSSLHKEKTRVISEAPSNIGTFVIDGMLFLRLLQKLPKILPSTKGCERYKRCQNENPQILFEITRPEQKGPNNFQDALHNNYLKKSLVKFRIYST